MSGATFSNCLFTTWPPQAGSYRAKALTNRLFPNLACIICSLRTRMVTDSLNSVTEITTQQSLCSLWWLETGLHEKSSSLNMQGSELSKQTSPSLIKTIQMMLPAGRLEVQICPHATSIKLMKNDVQDQSTKINQLQDINRDCFQSVTAELWRPKFPPPPPPAGKIHHLRRNAAAHLSSPPAFWTRRGWRWRTPWPVGWTATYCGRPDRGRWPTRSEAPLKKCGEIKTLSITLPHALLFINIRFLWC